MAYDYDRTAATPGQAAAQKWLAEKHRKIVDKRVDEIVRDLKELEKYGPKMHPYVSPSMFDYSPRLLKKLLKVV